VGRLRIANPSSSIVNYQVNGGAVLPGRPFAPGPNPPIYTPYFSLVGIQRELGPGVVGYGTNTVYAAFQDEDPYRYFTFGFDFNANVASVDDDLIAYVCRGWMLLMTTRGMALQPNPLLIPSN
jgi:hypothetical protein